MDIWKYVRRYTFSSPERQIDLLVEAASQLRGRKQGQVLDVVG